MAEALLWGMETCSCGGGIGSCEWRSSCTARPILPYSIQRAMGTGPRFNEQGSEFQHVQWDPKGGELYLDTVRPWESAVEASHRPDVHIELSDLAGDTPASATAEPVTSVGGVSVPPPTSSPT